MTTLSKLSQYGPTFQTKVIGALLTDRDFLITISESLSEDYFENTSHQWVIKEILKYFSKYHTVPSMEALKVEVQKIENDVLKIAIKEQLVQAYRESEQTDIQYIKDEFLGFCRNQQMKKAIIASTDLLSINDFDSIRQLILNALKVGEVRSIGHEYEKDVETRYREDSRSPIPFPWDVMNNITQGGYGKGELVIIFGNPGGGKSWAVIDMATHAAKLGFNVLYYTLELSETYVARRMDANLLRIPVDKILQHREEVEQMANEIPGKIKIKEFAAGKTTLDNIEQHVEQLRMQYEFVPDVIFIDYIDLLKNTSRDRLEGTEDIYTSVRGLARELSLPIVTPSQANRSGAKSDIIEGDNIAGSYSKLMIGDIVLSLARNRKDKLEGTGRWHVMKNRLGGDGMTFASTIDTSMGKIEIFEDFLEIENPITNPKANDYNAVDKDEKDFLRNFILNNDQAPF
jgi:replicative DNA helicase